MALAVLVWARWTVIAVLASPFLTYLLLRLVAVTLVRASMQRATGRLRSLPPSEEASSDRPPERALRFRLIDERTDLILPPSQQACLEQAAALGEETWRILQRSVLVSLGGLLAVAMLWAWLLPEGLRRPSFALGFLWLIFTAQMCFLFILARQTFASVHRIPAGFLISFYLLMIAPVAAILLLAGATDLGSSWWGFLLALGAGAAVLVHGYRKLSRHLRGLENHSLLILRVFGSDSNAAFVFGEILLRWCFLGSVTTIADPSYVRFQGSLASRQNRRYFVIFTCVYVAWIIVLASMGELVLMPWMSPPVAAIGGVLGWLGRAEMASAVTTALFVPVLLGLVVFFVRRQFNALKRLSADVGQPGSAVTSGGIFRRLVLYCHDDVWQQAVSSVLPASQAVLMDLRGFTPERRGCEFELGLLIDRFPIDRILFVVDPGPAQEALLSSLEKRWALMSADSPNRSLEEPVLTAYSPGQEDPGDIRRIVALLAGLLPSPPAAVPSPASPEALRIPGEKERPRVRPGWADRLGRLDLAVSTPGVAKVFIPVILSSMALYTYIQLRPVAQARRDLAVPRLLPVATLAETETPRPAPRPQPLLATARVRTNKPTQVRNRFALQEDLTLLLTLQGGPMAAAERGWISDLAVLGRDHRPLPIEEDFSKPVEESRKVSLTGGKGQFAVTVHPAEPIDGILRVSGHVTLEFLEPHQVLVVDQLDRKLPGRGWLRLSHPLLAPRGQVDLVRFDADNRLNIWQHGDLEVQIHLLRSDGTSASFMSLDTTEFLQQSLAPEDLPGVRLLIQLSPPRLEKAGFEIRTLTPVLKPKGTRLERFLGSPQP